MFYLICSRYQNIQTLNELRLTVKYLHVNCPSYCMSNSSVQSAPTDEQKASNRARFELELEFVQSLANPFYLQSLAQQNILDQPAFVNFLEYLLYWKEKDYARFIQYAQPSCNPAGTYLYHCQLSSRSPSLGTFAACSLSI